MRAAVLEAVGEPLVITDVPEPSPGPTDLLLRVRACGVCGSDLHASDTFVPPGRVLGHELCGEVVAVGAGARDRFREGQLVAGFPVSCCGTCRFCLDGAAAKCERAVQIGFQVPGAFAEYVAVPAAGSVALPADVDHRLGALVEPLAVGLHALDRTPTERGESVLVLGAGPVGLAVALWARALGAREVVVSDPVAHRRGLAEALGAAGVDPTADDVRSAFERIAGKPPRVVIECVGIPGLIQHAVELAAPDASVTVVGLCMGLDQIFPVPAMQKELTMRFVLYYRHGDFLTTVRMLGDRRIDPMRMVTATVGLDELPARFEGLKRPSTDCKILVEPDRAA